MKISASGNLPKLIQNFKSILILTIIFCFVNLSKQNNAQNTTASLDNLNTTSKTSNITKEIDHNLANYTVPKNVEIMPEAILVSPIRRQGTSHSEMNIAPCGGIEKRKAGLMTNRNSIINVIWEIRQPIQNGFCSVKISPGLEYEKNFTLLYPLEYSSKDSNAANSGEFPCGRMKGFESKKFQLPEDYVCDRCTLQWVWRTPAGNLYSCSDMMINGQKIEDCLASCFNGGACFNGKCICKDDYYGEFCQFNRNRINSNGWFIVAVLFLMVVGFGSYYIFKNRGDTWLTNRVFQNQSEFAENSQNPSVFNKNNLMQQ